MLSREFTPPCILSDHTHEKRNSYLCDPFPHSLSSSFSLFSDAMNGSCHAAEANVHRPLGYHVKWTQKPKSVLVIKKFRDRTVTCCFKKLISWLHDVERLRAFSYRENTCLFPPLPSPRKKTCRFTSNLRFSTKKSSPTIRSFKSTAKDFIRGFTACLPKGGPPLSSFLFPLFIGEDELKDKIDFIVCLGGDGTLLYASSLFPVRLV